MKIPEDKDYILYIKSAKTGGTSFLKYLKDIKMVKEFKRVNGKRILEDVSKGDIIVVLWMTEFLSKEAATNFYYSEK